MRAVLLILSIVTPACPEPPRSSADGRELPGLSGGDADAETSSFLEVTGDPDGDVIVALEDADTGPACVPSQCPDDGNPCTDPACDGAGRCTQVPNLRPCDDGSDCMVDDRCSAGQCRGRALDCDDLEACTDDACREGVGCVNTPRVGACDDDDACTVDDACSGGTCVGVARQCPVPPGSHGCSLATCDRRTGCGVRTTPGTCDDHDLCTTGEACDAGRCVGALVRCDDDDACTDDWCDPDAGCVSVPNAACCDAHEDCDDGDPCTSDRCDDGACAREPTCDDGDPCSIDRCDGGSCSADPSPVVPPEGLVLADFEAALGDAWRLVSDHPDVGWQRDDAWSDDGAWSLYVGKLPDYSYDFGAVRAVASWTVALPTDAAELGLAVRSEVAETSCSYDALVIVVDGHTLAPAVCGPTTGVRRWDVSRWAGTWITLELVFDTVDDRDNGGAGVWVDGIHVTRATSPRCCAPGTACDR